MKKLSAEIYLRNPAKSLRSTKTKFPSFFNRFKGYHKVEVIWKKYFRKHLLNNTVVKSCITDPALFYNLLGQELVGPCATYADDKLHAVTKEWRTGCEHTKRSLHVSFENGIL